MTKDNFYYKGEYFDTPEELFEYVKEWHKKYLTQETACTLLEGLKKDILLNLFLHGHQLSNQDFSIIIQEVFDFTLRKIREDNQNK